MDMHKHSCLHAHMHTGDYKGWRDYNSNPSNFTCSQHTGINIHRESLRLSCQVLAAGSLITLAKKKQKKKQKWQLLKGPHLFTKIFFYTFFSLIFPILPIFFIQRQRLTWWQEDTTLSKLSNEEGEIEVQKLAKQHWNSTGSHWYLYYLSDSGCFLYTGLLPFCINLKGLANRYECRLGIYMYNTQYEKLCHDILLNTV